MNTASRWGLVIIIPARFKSSRLPGKPLIKIAGKELILWVLEASLKAMNKKWTPGKVNGEIVRSEKRLPIQINLLEEN